MQKILVPCDFSDQTHQALVLAFDLARRSGGNVHLLHVVEPPLIHDNLITSPLTFESTLLNDLGEQSQQRLAQWTERYGNEKFTTHTDFGPPVGVMMNYIEANHIDLVVAGTKGASGLKEFFVGSNAEKIVRNASCPVIAVKKNETLASLRDIVFPNALEDGQEDLVMHVKALQHFLDATLHVVWINTPERFISDDVTQEQLQDFARHHMLKNFSLHIYNGKDEASGVIDFTHSIQASMIAMGTHGRHGLQHMLNGSVAEDVVNHVDCPIWTYAIKRK
jgi:nucleotide-binding universal stress UspA family protein